jgi:hypothetical protein
MPEINKEIYLGDGLYASWDGFMLKLRAPREDGDHWVGLEPAIYLDFRKFGDECLEDLQRRVEELKAKS